MQNLTSEQKHLQTIWRPTLAKQFGVPRWLNNHGHYSCAPFNVMGNRFLPQYYTALI